MITALERKRDFSVTKAIPKESGQKDTGKIILGKMIESTDLNITSLPDQPDQKDCARFSDKLKTGALQAAVLTQSMEHTESHGIQF